MANPGQELAMSIIDEVIKVLPFFDVQIQEQIKLRDKIEEKLNDYEITSKCTDLVTSDLKEKAYLFLACKKLEGMKDSTRYNYSLLFKRMSLYIIKPVSMITTMDLRLFIAKAYSDNKPSSANTKISNIKAFFGWLQDEGYILQNPSKNLMISKIPYRKRGSISNMDVEKMREQCNTIRQKALFEVLLSTGCRVSEITNATIDKIDWISNSMTVIGKGDKEREVFFSTRAKMFIQTYIMEREKKGIHSPSLFVASKKPYATLGQRSIEKEISKLADKAGITYNVFPHLFRHTFATIGVNQNISMPVLQKLMGHSSPNTTQGYYNLNNDNMKHEYKKIAL